MRPAPGLAGVLLLATFIAGCSSSFDRSLALTDQTVIAIADGDATYVSPADMAEVMLQAGFSREEILKDGPQVGDAIATSGGAQVRKGSVVSALFAVHSGALIVTSLERGTFVRPLATQNLTPASAQK